MGNVTVNITGVQILDGMQAVILKLKAPADEAVLRPFADDFKPGKDYAALLGEKRQKRSLDANRYAWVLLNKLGQKLNLPAVEIYRNMIRDVGGASEIVPVRDDAAERWVRIWESRGDGWQCEKLDNAYMPGYSLYQCWYGSSVYDSRQMSRLLELIVAECKLQGVQTETPEEIARMVSLMEGADGKK